MTSATGHALPAGVSPGFNSHDCPRLPCAPERYRGNSEYTPRRLRGRRSSTPSGLARLSRHMQEYVTRFQLSSSRCASLREASQWHRRALLSSIRLIQAEKPLQLRPSPFPHSYALFLYLEAVIGVLSVRYRTKAELISWHRPRVAAAPDLRCLDFRVVNMRKHSLFRRLGTPYWSALSDGLAQRNPPFTDDKEAGYAEACHRTAVRFEVGGGDAGDYRVSGQKRKCRHICYSHRSNFRCQTIS
jgi:hypothetical protein